MKVAYLAANAVLAASPTLAQEQRGHDAHVHGVSKVEIAIEGNAVEVALHAPGIDIVGFEHVAKTDEDKAIVAAALELLGQADAVVTLDASAGCRVEAVEAKLSSDDEHGEGEHEEAHDEHAHDDHSDEDKEHDDHDAEGATHSEFEAHYHFECDAPDAVTSISFTFFNSFPNTAEIEVQFVTEVGAGAAKLTRDNPVLSLE